LQKTSILKSNFFSFQLIKEKTVFKRVRRTKPSLIFEPQVDYEMIGLCSEKSVVSCKDAYIANFSLFFGGGGYQNYAGDDHVTFSSM